MKITNKFGMPVVYEEAIRRRFYKSPIEADKERTSIGVTTLIDAPWQRFLRRKHEAQIDMDVIDGFFAFRGEMVHKILEDVRMPNVIKELYLQVKHKSGLFISGVIDLWLPYEINDYKTKSVNSAFYYNAFDELANEQQLNIYRWLMFKTYGIDNIQKQMIHRIFFDWVQRKAKSDSNYPQSPHKEYNIKLWSWDKIEEYIDERMRLHLLTEDIPICNEQERWTKPTEFALMKNGNKRATKLYKKENGYEKIEDCPTPEKGFSIVVRPGVDTRCVDYCSVCEFCPFWQKTYKDIKPELSAPTSDPE